MTDNDQEVVREPFEDGESIRSANQSLDDMDSVVDGARYSTDLYQRSTAHTRDSTPIEDYMRQSEHISPGDESSSEDNYSSKIEDIKFAKKFGIQLKDKGKGKSRRELAYDKLLKSSHMNETTEPKTSPGPALKTSITSDCIYHKGTFYQKGDIVALSDREDGRIYFAQLTGFLQDQYCEKSASLNWLVPNRPTSREFFDPQAYRLGLEDTQLRKLDCMTFVRHCPHDYYVRKFFQTDHDSTNEKASVCSRSTKDRAFIWTTMEPCRVPKITNDQR